MTDKLRMTEKQPTCFPPIQISMEERPDTVARLSAEVAFRELAECGSVNAEKILVRLREIVLFSHQGHPLLHVRWVPRGRICRGKKSEYKICAGE
jgi:hypothetical protein